MLPVWIVILLGLLFCVLTLALMEAKRARKSRLWRLVFSRTKWLNKSQSQAVASKGRRDKPKDRA